MIDTLMGAIENSEEPDWLEKNVGKLRVWHIMFFCLAAVTTLIVIVCCCFRFRIPRTKQQIEADYHRRKITTKFRQQLETIQDSKMDTISLKDGTKLPKFERKRVSSPPLISQYQSGGCTTTTSALEILHEKTARQMEDNQQGSQPSSIMSPQQSSLDAPFQPEGGQKPEPQAGANFVKFATKVANLSKLGHPRSPTSPSPSDNKMDF